MIEIISSIITINYPIMSIILEIICTSYPIRSIAQLLWTIVYNKTKNKVHLYICIISFNHAVFFHRDPVNPSSFSQTIYFFENIYFSGFYYKTFEFFEYITKRLCRIGLYRIWSVHDWATNGFTVEYLISSLYTICFCKFNYTESWMC